MFTIKTFRKRSPFGDVFGETLRKEKIISLNPLYDVIIDVFKSFLQEDYVHS